jgi:hypothetical protein
VDEDHQTVRSPAAAHCQGSHDRVAIDGESDLFEVDGEVVLMIDPIERSKATATQMRARPRVLGEF